MAIKTKYKQIGGTAGFGFMQLEAAEFKFPSHFHDTFVIQLVEYGRDFCELNELAAKQGHVFLHFPRAPHAGFSRVESRYSAIYPTADLVADITEIPEMNFAYGYSCVVSKPSLVADLGKLFNCLRNSNSLPNDISGIRNLIEFVLEFKAQETPIVIPDWICQTCDYLKRHYFNNVSILELSEMSGLSRSHFIRSFKNWTGISPHQFLISERVARARELLLAGKSSAEVAIEVGFADQAHLCRTFKRWLALSPGKMVN